MSEIVIQPNFASSSVETGKQGIIGNSAANNTLFSGFLSEKMR